MNSIEAYNDNILQEKRYKKHLIDILETLLNYFTRQDPEDFYELDPQEKERVLEALSWTMKVKLLKEEFSVHARQKNSIH